MLVFYSFADIMIIVVIEREDIDMVPVLVQKIDLEIDLNRALVLAQRGT